MNPKDQDAPRAMNETMKMFTGTPVSYQVNPPRERGYACEAPGASRPDNTDYANRRAAAACSAGHDAIAQEIMRAREMGQREGKQDALAGMMMHQHLLKTIDDLNSRIARQATTISNLRHSLALIGLEVNAVTG